MFKVNLFFSFLLLTKLCCAQFSVTGKVMESEESKPLSFTSISVFNKIDSNVVATGISTEGGEFSIVIEDTGKYVIQFNYLGYVNQSIELELSANKTTINVGRVVLERSIVSLKEVSVVAEAALIRLKGDTIEHNAKAYHLPDGTNVEGLLKKIPGIEVDEAGNIYIKGKKVNRILVEGKDFFSGKPTLATKNLEAEMINTVEIFEKNLTKQSLQE